MPSIHIKTVKLDQVTKNLMAERLYETYKNVIKMPTIEIFFDEYENYYIQGKLVDTCNTITVKLQGHPLSKEEKADLCKSIAEVVKNSVNDPSFKMSNFYYESPNHDDYGLNGKLLSDLLHH